LQVIEQPGRFQIRSEFRKSWRIFVQVHLSKKKIWSKFQWTMKRCQSNKLNIRSKIKFKLI
jgi:hypothetical protein